MAAAFLCVCGFDLVLIPEVMPLAPGLAALGLVPLAFRNFPAISLRITRTELWLAALCSWAAFSWTWSIDPKATLLAISQYGNALLAMVLITRVSMQEHLWRRIGWSYVYGCFVAAVYFVLFSRVASDTMRYGVEGVNANYVAYSLASGFPVLLTLLRTGRRMTLIRFGLMLAWMAAAVAAILLSGSRGATMAVALCLMVFVLGRKKSALPISAALLVFGVLLASAATDFLPPDLRGRFVLGTGEIDSSYRFDTWPIALGLFIDRPWTGIGAAAFTAANEFELLAHNLVLSVGAEMGVPGLLIYAAVVFGIYRSFPVRAVPMLRLCRMGFFVTWLPIALTGAWDSSFVAWLVFAWFGAAASWAPVLSSAARTPTRKKPRDFAAAGV